MTPLIMGLHAITEMLNSHPKRLLKVFILDSQKRDKRKSRVITQLREKRIEIEFISKDRLSRLTGSDSHQGIAAYIKKREEATLESFFKEAKRMKKCFVLMLDEITDPHNLGAILRSSECFGVSAIILSQGNAAPITPTVSKVSCGASEFLKTISVKNLPHTLELFKKEGFKIIGSNVSKEASDLNSFSYPEKTLFILGSEGKGVRSQLLKKCDHHLYIPMKGKIDSLNVSNAAAVFLSRIN